MFMNSVKDSEQECVNIEKDSDDLQSNKKMVQLDLLLFEREDESDTDSDSSDDG